MSHLIKVELFGSVIEKKGEYRMLGGTFCFNGINTLKPMLHEQFALNSYYFECEHDNPVIFDVGANIGDSLFYFKYLYPNAQIYCFEPVKSSFAMLQKNSRVNSFQDVSLFNEGLFDTDGEAEIVAGSDGSAFTLMVKEESADSSTMNEKIRLRQLSKRIPQLGIKKIDLVKIDIEGSETAVMRDVEPVLNIVDRIIIEFHPVIDYPGNSCDTILNILKRNNFSICSYTWFRTEKAWTAPKELYIAAEKK